MASQEFDLSDEGVIALAARIDLTELDLVLTTVGPNVRYESTTNPRRLFGGGWVSFAFLFDVTPLYQVWWWRFMEHERESRLAAQIIPGAATVSVHFVPYHVYPGNVIHMTLNY